ncbi:MAG: HD domain-containing protein [Candidatus Thorarchaeota archaeon]
MTMKDGLEEKLKQLVISSTSKAAREEWLKAQQESEVPLFNYRYSHVSEVVVIAKHLTEATGADMDIVTTAAWLHDFAKPGMGGVSDHGEKSAQDARKILLKEGIDPNAVEKICDTIRKHVGLTLDSPLEPLEAQILWEADKLVKLGVTVFAHMIVYMQEMRPDFSLKDLADELREYLSLAKRIAASMNTDRAQELAQIRLNAIRSVSELLDSEIMPGKQVR